jgi:transcriptional regulator
MTQPLGAENISLKDIPNSLRTIGPFLEEAQKIMKHTDESSLKVTIFCIDLALKLVDQFGLVIDDETKLVLIQFREKRNEIARKLEVPELDDQTFETMITRSHSKDISAEDILIAEGNATLKLADQQFEESMHHAAARNYHTATIYFRVLESMVPRLTSRVHERLTYAASRTQQSSPLTENLVHEHFEGLRCVDFYEIIESKMLGKGSYGSVYLCKHRKTGDEFACKVMSMSRINSHYLRKLHSEIAIMKEVDHPNIIKLRYIYIAVRTSLSACHCRL